MYEQNPKFVPEKHKKEELTIIPNIMKKEDNAVQHDSTKDTAAALLIEQNEKSEGGTAATVPPANENPAGEHESVDLSESTTTTNPVTQDPVTVPGSINSESSSSELPLDAEVKADIKTLTSNVDLDAIAVDQDFAQMIAVKTESAAATIGKAKSQTWFSPHPDPKRWRSFLTIRDQADRDAYHIINPSLAEELAGEFTTTLLVPCMSKQGSLFFWPIKLPGEDGKIDSWNESAFNIAVAKGGQWIRLNSNQSTGSYDTVTPVKKGQEPEWPEDILGALQKAINKVYIAELNHPLVKRLLGEE